MRPLAFAMPSERRITNQAIRLALELPDNAVGNPADHRPGIRCNMARDCSKVPVGAT